MRMGTMAMAVLWLGGCLVPNTQYREPPPDQHVAMDFSSPMPDQHVAMDFSSPMPDLLVPPDLFQLGMNRPEVLITGGSGNIEGKTTTVANFYMDVFDVTVGAYRVFFNSPQESGQMTANLPSTGQDCNWTASPGAKETHPLNCVTFAQASAFCSWAMRRLPTEEEWAYAAYGAADGAADYPWGTTAPQNGGGDGGVAQLCWSQNNGTCPVGSYPETLLGQTVKSKQPGLADMAGNVYQWLNSQYAEPYVGQETTCSTNCSLRGGSWFFNGPSDFGAATRDVNDPGDASSGFGFRCARTP